jgi:hypothetical protein
MVSCVAEPNATDVDPKPSESAEPDTKKAGRSKKPLDPEAIAKVDSSGGIGCCSLIHVMVLVRKKKDRNRRLSKPRRRRRLPRYCPFRLFIFSH